MKEPDKLKIPTVEEFIEVGLTGQESHGGLQVAIVGLGHRDELLGESPIKKVVEIMNSKGKKVGETDLLLKNPSQKEIQKAKAQELLEKYQLEQRMRLKLRQAGLTRKTKQEQHKKNKRSMTKKSRKRNRKK